MISLLDGENLDSPNDVLHYIHEQQSNPQSHSFAVIKNRRFIGVIGFEIADCGQHAFVYYWLGKVFRGQGAASQALKCCIDQAKTQGLKNLLAFVWPDNLTSQKLLLANNFTPLSKQVLIQDNKLGFVLPLEKQQPMQISVLNQLVDELGF